MASITIFARNILETGTVTVTGTPDTGYAKERLYDRSISLFWKDTGATTYVIHVDQGAANIHDVDFLAIEKHNFDAKNLYWQFSDNDSVWTNSEAIMPQSGNDQIIVEESSPATHRYWRFWLSTTDPMCSEIYMSEGATFNVRSDPAPEASFLANVQWNRSVGGLERSTKFGAKRRVRNYEMFLSAADLATWRAAVDLLEDYSLPFYIKDHDGNYYMCRFQEPPTEIFDNPTHTHVEFSVIEEL